MNFQLRVLIAAFLVLVATSFIACGDTGEPILLFNGIGTSSNDVLAIETILNSNHLTYSTVSSSQINEMSESQIREHRLLIIPGGNFIEIGNGLDSGATANIRKAIQHGLNYFGVCAGGFFAGNSGYNGLNLTLGVRFSFYAAESRGIRKSIVPIAGVGVPTLGYYWEDGPQFSGWGEVVGKYPDGTPAIVQGTFGNGWVVLSGVHPEAPANWWHSMTPNSSASAENAFAGVLILAALNRTSLSHY
jgi:glutamine amidotransferase-like uncharacterized protein